MTATLDGTADFTAWRTDDRCAVCADGKCLRSTFMYVGWLCGREVTARLSGYGEASGEVFQLRDDLLGVVATHELADRTTRREPSDVMSAPCLAPTWIDGDELTPEARATPSSMATVCTDRSA